MAGPGFPLTGPGPAVCPYAPGYGCPAQGVPGRPNVLPAGKWILLTTVLGSSMAMLDSTVVNVALPRIGRDLDADLAGLQWTVNAYMLTLAGLILLGGALGDRFGRRKVFVVGVVWFAAASLLCGLAPSAGVLVAARALQGIGGALLTPGSLALIQASFHPDDRARAVGLWSGFGGIGAAVGPFLGGWLVDGPGWRWVFLLNVPLALLCAPIALRHVPESKDDRVHGRGFDVLGAALGALALALVTYALIEASAGSLAVVAVTAAAGVAAGVAFVAVERRRADPMMPLDIFASRQFTAVNVVTLCVYAAFGGFFFLSALQLQVVAGYSALGAGTALLPTTVLMLFLSARSGELAQRIGPRIPLTVGPLLCAAGMLLMLRVGHRRLVRRRRAARRAGARPRHGHAGRAAHRDRARLRGRRPGGPGQRHQQRGGPGGRPDRRGRAAAARRDGRGGVPVGGRLRRRVPAGDAPVRGGPGRGRGDRLRDRTEASAGLSAPGMSHARQRDGPAAGAEPVARAAGVADRSGRRRVRGASKAGPQCARGRQGQADWNPWPSTRTSSGDRPRPTCPTTRSRASSWRTARAPADVAAKYPTSSLAWAQLADEAYERGSVVESYAYARTGYHRGLDSLRRNGWKGHGPVPWEHEPNRGFLRALHGLARAAQAIGEQEEYERCSQFLKDSSPAAAQTLG